MPEPPTAAYLLVTGSRKHDAETAHIIEAGLIEAGQHLGRDTVLIHGAARGADRIAAAMWAGWGLPVEAYPADWDGDCVVGCTPMHRRQHPGGGGTYCPDAGDRRNKAMVDLMAGLFEAGHRVLCVGFPYPGQRQGGTFNCLRDWRAVRPVLPKPWVRADPNVGRRAG